MKNTAGVKFLRPLLNTGEGRGNRSKRELSGNENGAAKKPCGSFAWSDISLNVLTTDIIYSRCTLNWLE